MGRPRQEGEEDWARLIRDEEPSRQNDRTVHVHLHAGTDGDERSLSKIVVYVVASLTSIVLLAFAVRWIQLQIAQDAMNAIIESSNKTAAQIQRNAAAAQERAERERAQRAAEQQRQIDEQNARIEAVRDLERRRESAWSRFYLPSDFCRNPDNRATMQCANEHARAKKDFDQRWAEGKL